MAITSILSLYDGMDGGVGNVWAYNIISIAEFTYVGGEVFGVGE